MNPETGFGVPDAFDTIWLNSCVRFDVMRIGTSTAIETNYRIDLADLQLMNFLWGQKFGDLLYHQRFDLAPTGAPDGDIDASDIQKVYARFDGHCAEVN